MKRLSFPAWTFPLFLLAICIAAYGLLIPWLGLYQDDWYQLWFSQAFGTGVFVDFYSFERPFIALIYMLTTPLLGTDPTTWQVFALIGRWLAVLSVVWVMRKSWGRLSQPVMWLALLFAVYPGFRQQPAAVIYSHYFLQFAIQMASIGVMIIAVRSPRRYWPLTALAVAMTAFGIFTSEYFFGLEIARPFFLWLEAADGSLRPARAKLAKVARQWAPYLFVLVVFLVWRLLIFRFPTYQPFYENYPGQSLPAILLEFLRTVLAGLVDVGLLAWLLPVRTLLEQSLSQPSTLVALGLAAGVTLLVFIYLYFARSDAGAASTSPTVSRRSRAGWMIVTGLVTLLAAGLPFWFVDLPVDLVLDSGSRFGIAFMLSACLLLVGVLELLPCWRLLQYGIVAVLVGLGCSQHFLDANYYRLNHQIQATFFQHLRWRAPELEPGTVVLSNQLLEALAGDNSITAALNWVYDPTPEALKYMLLYLPNRLEIGTLPALEPGLEFDKEFRTAVFHGSTDDALAVYFDYPQCLRVLDPEIEPALPRPAGMPGELKAAAHLQPGADPA